MHWRFSAIGLALRREGGTLKVIPPSLPPQAVEFFKALKPALLYAMEDGETLQPQDLLRLERLVLLLLGRELPVSAWCTVYPKGERVLVPPGHLRPHMLWRVRNVDAPKRLHLATTTGTLTLDLRAPVEALMRAKVGGLEIILGGPVGDVREYLAAAARVMVQPDGLEVEGPGGRWDVGSWKEALEVLTMRRGVA